MSKFKVGDRVRVNLPASRRHGQETVVTSDLWFSDSHRATGGRKIKAWVHTVALEPGPSAQCVAFRPEHLEPIYDGNERVSWSSCVWQPKSLERA